MTPFGLEYDAENDDPSCTVLPMSGTFVIVKDTFEDSTTSSSLLDSDDEQSFNAGRNLQVTSIFLLLEAFSCLESHFPFAILLGEEDERESE